MWLNYFKTAKRQSVQWHRPMQDFVNGEDFCPFIEEPTRSEIRRYHPGNFFSISCVAIAVENLTRRRRRKNCDASTYQSNNFGVSRKRFKPSTPGSKLDISYYWPVLGTYRISGVASGLPDIWSLLLCSLCSGSDSGQIGDGYRISRIFLQAK